jgi:hypothetical protein
VSKVAKEFANRMWRDASAWWRRRQHHDQPDTEELTDHLEKSWVVVPGSPRASRRWWFAFAALLLGGIILSRGWLFGPQPLSYVLDLVFDEFLNHLGEAFLVSAIVIVIFEWASEFMYAASLAASLASILKRHINTVIKASSRDAIARAMRDLAGPHGETFETQFKDFAEAIAKLGAKAGWASNGYFDFIAWYHRQLVEKVQQLADLSEKLKDHPHSSQDFRFPLPDASDVADVMLAQTMKSMIASGCGSYYALSDAFTWTKLPAFRQALRDATTSGIVVRRLFVIGRPSDIDLPMSRLAIVIYDHLEEAAQSHRYDMRIIDDDEYRLHEPVAFEHMLHFGIFRAAGEESPLMFGVLKSDLSDYRITGGTATERAITEFDTLFDSFPALKECHGAIIKSEGPRKTKVVSGDILIRDYLLAYRVKRLRDRGRYNGVSGIDLWEDEEFEHFHAATMAKLETTQIKVQRIFCFKNEDDADRADVIQLLSRHAGDAADETSRRGMYEWQVCLKKTLPPELEKEGSFGIFRDESDDGQIVGETAIKDSPHLFTAEKGKYARLAKIFDEFWKALASNDDNKKLVDRLKNNGAPSSVIKHDTL